MKEEDHLDFAFLKNRLVAIGIASYGNPHRFLYVDPLYTKENPFIDKPLNVVSLQKATFEKDVENLGILFGFIKWNLK